MCMGLTVAQTIVSIPFLESKGQQMRSPPAICDADISFQLDCCEFHFASFSETFPCRFVGASFYSERVCNQLFVFPIIFGQLRRKQEFLKKIHHCEKKWAIRLTINRLQMRVNLTCTCIVTKDITLFNVWRRVHSKFVRVILQTAKVKTQKRKYLWNWVFVLFSLIKYMVSFLSPMQKHLAILVEVLGSKKKHKKQKKNTGVRSWWALPFKPITQEQQLSLFIYLFIVIGLSVQRITMMYSNLHAFENDKQGRLSASKPSVSKEVQHQ